MNKKCWPVQFRTNHYLGKVKSCLTVSTGVECDRITLILSSSKKRNGVQGFKYTRGGEWNHCLKIVMSGK